MSRHVWVGLAMVAVIAACDASEEEGPTLVPDETSVGTSGTGGSDNVGGNATTTSGTSSSSSSGVGGSETSFPGYQSGSRLKARTLDGPDGSKHFLGWYDSLKDTDCSFLFNALDGWRCMPTNRWANEPAGVDYYSNANCTQQVRLATYAGCGQPYVDPPTAKFVVSSDSCFLIHTVQQVFQTYYSKHFSSTTCQGPFNGVAYLVGPEVPSSEWAAANETINQ